MRRAADYSKVREFAHLYQRETCAGHTQAVICA
jgi:hypothetical protein